MLRRVTIERQESGSWRLVRSRDDSGESFICLDLQGAFDAVLAAYHEDGSPRKHPAFTWATDTTSKGTETNR